MSPLALILFVILVLILFGGFGHYSGYYTTGGPYLGYGYGLGGLLVVILLILLLTGRL